MTRRGSPGLWLLWLATACGPSADTRAFVERLGDDTTSVEIFTRTADRIEGAFVIRSPVTQVARYTAHIDADGAISLLEVTWSTPPTNPDGPASQRHSIQLEGDSAIIRVEELPEAFDTRKLEVPASTLITTGKTPLTVALFEHAARLARAAGGERFEIAVLRPGSRRGASENAIVARGSDSISIGFFGNPLLAALDAEGRIEGVSGRETTLKVEIDRVDPSTFDLDSLAADFAARDARGEGFGLASPRGADTASVGDATITLDYGRPSKRGREIFGGVVPWNVVWRTGANAATHFSSDADLVVGGEPVPAGTYTLWTTFTPDDALLIISRLTDVWGTQYDHTHDLARVPLAREDLSEVVEQLAIAVEPSEGGGGVLALSWDTSRFTVPIEVARR